MWTSLVSLDASTIPAAHFQDSLTGDALPRRQPHNQTRPWIVMSFLQCRPLWSWALWYIGSRHFSLDDDVLWSHGGSFPCSANLHYNAASHLVILSQRFAFTVSLQQRIYGDAFVNCRFISVWRRSWWAGQTTIAPRPWKTSRYFRRLDGTGRPQGHAYRERQSSHCQQAIISHYFDGCGAGVRVGFSFDGRVGAVISTFCRVGSL